MPGMEFDMPTALKLEERSPVREQQGLEVLATWLERFSSFVSIAGKDVLLLEIAGSLRLFGGLPSLRQAISKGLLFVLSSQIFSTASLAEVSLSFSNLYCLSFQFLLICAI